MIVFIIIFLLVGNVFSLNVDNNVDFKNINALTSTQYPFYAREAHKITCYLLGFSVSVISPKPGDYCSSQIVNTHIYKFLVKDFSGGSTVKYACCEKR